MNHNYKLDFKRSLLIYFVMLLGTSGMCQVTPPTKSNYAFSSGTFEVDEKGAANFYMPIMVAQGTNGMAPTFLSVSYNHRSGNGLMGQGFTLNGFSAISLTGLSRAHDEDWNTTRNAATGFSTEFNKARLTKDGIRMVVTAPVAGQPLYTDYWKSSFILEQFDGSKFDVVGWRDGRPQSFKEETKDGLFKYYGGTADSKVFLPGSTIPLQYLLSKIEDRYGNTMDISYFRGSNPDIMEFYPAKITYTSNPRAGLAPFAEVSFIYTPRQDVLTEYVGGFKSCITQRLSRIVSSCLSVPIRNYQFNYLEPNGTTRTVSRLNMIQESAQNEVLSPIKITWKEKIVKQMTADFNSVQNPAIKDVIWADWNNDGLTDYARVAPEGTSFFLNNGNGYSAQPINKDITMKNIRIGDFDGDTKIDILWYDSTNGQFIFWMNKADGKTVSFIPVADDKAFKTAGLTREMFKGAKQVYCKDINQDGQVDLEIFNVDPNGFILTSTGECYLTEFRWGNTIKANFQLAYRHRYYAPVEVLINLPVGVTALYIDLDNNGLLETVFWNPINGQYWVVRKESVISNSDVNAKLDRYGIKIGTSEDLLPAGAVIQNSNRQVNWTVTLNQDELPDIVVFDNNARTITTYINKGNYIFEPASVINLDNATEKFVDNQTKLILADFSGDGIDDFLFTKPNASKQLVNRLYTTSTGPVIKLTNKVDNFLPSEVLKEGDSNIEFGTFNENATWGLCFLRAEGANSQLSTFQLGAADEDKVSGIELGNGLQISPVYSLISTTKNYSRTLPSDSYRLNLKENEWWLAPLHSGLVVVAGLEIKGGGITRKIVYNYSIGTMDLLRGFQGFKIVTQKGNYAGSNKRSYFTFQNIGISKLYKFREETLGANVAVMTIAVYVPRAIAFGNTKAWTEWVGEKIYTEFDITGKIKHSSKEIVNCDQYRNTLMVEVDYGGGHRDVTISEFPKVSRDTDWVPGRLMKATLQRFAPDKPTITRVSSFEYSLSTPSLTKEVSFANLSEQKLKSKEYVYDNLGNIVLSKETAWNGTTLESRETRTTYDGTGRFVATKTNALGQVERFSFEQRLGKLISYIDINGISTTKSYDDLGREVSTNNADGSWTKRFIVGNGPAYGFTPSGTTYLVISLSSNGQQLVSCHNVWDWKLREVSTGFDGKNVIKDFKYDENKGLPIAESLPYFQADGNPLWSKLQYNVHWQVEQITFPDNTTERISYAERSVNQENRKGQRTTTFYNERKAMIRKRNELGQNISYDVDADGNTLSITDAGGILTLRNTYDERGLRIVNTTSDRGIITTSYNGFEEVIAEKNPRGDITQIVRDRLGREIERRLPEGTTKITYDQVNKGVGKISEVRQWNGAVYTYNYDGIGRFLSKKTVIDGRTFNESVTYDNIGRIASKTKPNGIGERYGYNSFGYLFNAVGSDNKIIWNAGWYEARGLLKSEAIDASKYTTLYNYDTNGFMVFANTVNTSNIQNSFQTFSFTYDALGNLLKRSDGRTKRYEDFQYDALNRLTSSKVDNQPAVTISYDASSRITSKSDVGTYKYRAGSYQLTSVNLAEQDKCIPSFKVSSDYWSFSRLKSAVIDSIQQEYHYDWANNLIKTERINRLSGLRTTTYHLNDYQEEVTGGNVSKQSSFVTILGKKKAAHITQPGKSAGWLFYFHDHLGSITMVTNEKNEIARLAYNAWGERRNADTWQILPRGRNTSTPFSFTGHIEADDFGLVFAQARLYDPILGLFISPDEIIQDIADVTALNSYAYCAFNPVSVVDPDGYFSFKDVVRVVVNVVKVVLPVVVGVVLTTIAAPLGPVVAGAIGGFGRAATAALLNGSSVSGALKVGLKGGLSGGLSAGLAFGVGEFASKIGGSYGAAAAYGVKVIGHGVSQGAVSYASGGQFAHGFMSGAFTAAASPAIDKIPFYSGRVAAAAMVGGTASSLGGGSFANGAMTGAFVRMFNEESHMETKSYCGSPNTTFLGLKINSEYFVPDFLSTPFGRVNMSIACERHDLCYSTLSMSKYACDLKLRQDIIETNPTHNGITSLIYQQEVKAIANIYYHVVSSTGLNEYTQAQQNIKK